MKLSDLSIHAFIQEHQIKNESGIPLDFRDHLFLFDIYSDQSSKLVCYKAAQIGFSTMAIIKSLWLAKMKGMDIIYTMPSSSDMKDFVGGKVNRIINQNPILLEYVKDKDSIEQKAVGDSIIYYRGTFTEKAAIAVSSDLNIHDEENKKSSSSMHRVYNTLNSSSSGILVIHQSRVMVYQDTGPRQIKNIGSFLARIVLKNNTLHGLILSTKQQGLSFANFVRKNSREKNGVLVVG